MGLPPRRIGILTSIDGVGFEDAWDNRKLATFGDIEVPVIGAADFVTNKRATGRAKDLVDADTIELLLQK